MAELHWPGIPVQTRENPAMMSDAWGQTSPSIGFKPMVPCWLSVIELTAS
jgi:hypothetical protein